MLGDSSQYEKRGPFGRACDAALKRIQQAQVDAPARPSCKVEAHGAPCGLNAGHAERSGTPHRSYLSPPQTMFGLPVEPCAATSDHDWHSNGLRFCPGLPAVTEQPDRASLVAGEGFRAEQL